MRAPLKLNRAGWPRWLHRFAVEDPRALADAAALAPEAFSRHLSVLKFGTTFKTTRPGRHAVSNALVAQLYRGQRPVILDVGASDGSTSLDLLGVLGDGFARYFVTDLGFSVRHGRDARGVHFFRDASGACILRASRRLVAYRDVEGARPPLGLLSRLLLRGARRVRVWSELALVQPALVERAARDGRVVIQRYDVFTPWTGPRPDLIKVANVLNRIYFGEQQIAAVLADLGALVRDGGRLLLLDNRGDDERFTLFRKLDGRWTTERSFGGGCEVASLFGATAPAGRAAG